MRNKKEILNIICAELNNSVDLKSSLAIIIDYVKKVTGCGAVGIRLHEKGDFPYYVHNGFPEPFIKQENSLRVPENDPGVNNINSEDCNIEDCLCGRIILGRQDNDEACFSAKGSFWTNQNGDNQPAVSGRFCSRNYCGKKGYQTIALIPITSGEDRIGLIQVNDKRSEALNEDMIRFLETVGEKIGLSLQNSLLYEELKNF